MHGNVGKNIISLLDLFGFEDFAENSFEQLCINYANESLQYYINKLIFKTEQAEYAKEKIEWTPIGYHDNNAILHILSKKPVCSFWIFQLDMFFWQLFVYIFGTIATQWARKFKKVQARKTSEIK